MKELSNISNNIICNTCLSQSFDLDMGAANAGIKEYFFKDFWLCFGKVEKSNNKLFDISFSEPSIKMIFQFCGSRTFNMTGLEKAVNINCNSHTLLYSYNGQLKFDKACEEQGFLELSCKPQFLLNYLPNIDIFHSFIESINKKESVILQSENSHITVAMQAIIDSILASDRTGQFQQLFLEAKVKELLLLQLESYSRKVHQDTELLQKYHANKIYEAKAIIEANVGKPCSLIDLAHKVGTNECTLKKGFRALLDTSVHNYWNELKMKKAMQMLTESEAAVADIALDIGFKTPQHFSTAFKKHYGITPGAARNQKVKTLQ